VMKNDPIEQEKVIKYKDLVANAVLFQNVVDLTDILRDLQKQGYLISREDVAVVSPYTAVPAVMGYTKVITKI